VDADLGTMVDDVARSAAAFMLAGFVVTFLVTRFVTHMIRAGRGPFRDTSVGGVHVHHQVYGIFLLIGTGALEFTYNPDPPWEQVVAALFGVGAALTLDEFALWLRLDDVYWGVEGRRSVDAVLVATVVGFLLLLGASPVDTEDGLAVGSVSVGLNLLFALVAILKGRIVYGIVGLLVPLVALIIALRLAHPRSPWARRFYKPGSRRRARAERRFPEGKRTRWDALVDVFAGPVPTSNQTTQTATTTVPAGTTQPPGDRAPT
jgi:hypothetical protein